MREMHSGSDIADVTYNKAKYTGDKKVLQYGLTPKIYWLEEKFNEKYIGTRIIVNYYPPAFDHFRAGRI
jgi:hypothetical protein